MKRLAFICVLTILSLMGTPDLFAQGEQKAIVLTFSSLKQDAEHLRTSLENSQFLYFRETVLFTATLVTKRNTKSYPDPIMQRHIRPLSL
jgi:gluconate kinase